MVVDFSNLSQIDYYGLTFLFIKHLFAKFKRVKIRYHEELGKENALGFHIPKMWDKILDIKKCWLQEDPSNDIRNEIRAFANKHGMEFFNPRENSGFLRTLMIRTASTGEIMVLLQFFKEDVENRELILKIGRAHV